VVLYVLLDLKRAGLGVRELVDRLEQAVMTVLSEYGVHAEGRPKAPGVYVNRQKIAALGLRIRRGCSYHGLSVNVDMNLAPFQQINPCGDPGLETIDMKRLGIHVPWDQVASRLGTSLASQLGYSRLRTLDRRN
jgi:lipoyl(octanoyl) transferase